MTSTTSGGTAYALATATSTISEICAATTIQSNETSATVTYASQCAPTSIVSSYDGYGIEYLEELNLGGASYDTTTSDAGACCQLCVETYQCATSAWDSTGSESCHLDFVAPDAAGPAGSSGACGNGLLGLYDAGPEHPLSPGAGWYIGTGCGYAEYASAPPDDGT